jgi:type I restriction-modification system DNA methylase subunit
MAKVNQKQSNGSVLNFDTQLGRGIDDAMGAVERENSTLKGVLPRDYARPSLDHVQLGGLVDVISNIGFNESAVKSKNVIGRVYEYFLGKFASAEGNVGMFVSSVRFVKKGAEIYANDFYPKMESL